MSNTGQQLELLLFCDGEDIEHQSEKDELAQEERQTPRDLVDCPRVRPVFFPVYNRKNALLKSPHPNSGTPQLEVVPSLPVGSEKGAFARRTSEAPPSDRSGLKTDPPEKYLKPDQRTHFEATGRRDLLGIYLSEMGKAPRLTREQEAALGKQFEEAQKETMAVLAEFPPTVRHMLRLFDQYESGERALSGIIWDRSVPISSADDSGEQSDTSLSAELFDDQPTEEQPERGLDSKVVKAQIKDLRAAYEQVRQLGSTNDIADEPMRLARERLRGDCAEFYFTAPLIRQQVKQLQEIVDRIHQHEGVIRACCIEKAGMTEAVFARLFSGNEANQAWLFDLFVANDGDSEHLAKEVDRILLMQKRLRRIEQETGLSIQEVKAVARRAAMAQSAADQIKHQFVEANLRLVVWVAGRYRWFVRPGMAHLDLIQEGNIGLMAAVDRYNYRFKFKFATMAIHWIRQAISRAIGNQARMIRVPISVFAQISRVRTAYRKCVQDQGREPTTAQLAELVELPLDQVDRLLVLDREPIPLQSPHGDDDDMEMIGVVEDITAPSPLVEAMDSNLRRQIHQVLGDLTKRERTLVCMRFGIGMRDEYTLEQIGKQFNVIKQRAYQIESKTIRKLRHPDRAAQLQDFL